MNRNHPDFIAPPQVLAELKDLLDEYAPEWSGDGVEEHYLSIPIGHNEALEIELIRPMGEEEDQLCLFVRRWAPDHGLNDEQWLAWVEPRFPYLVPGIVGAWFTESNRREAEMQNAWSEPDGL